jgi:hypothetical protein
MGCGCDFQEKQGAVSEDETIVFRQQLLSLGIKDPVTKAKFGSGIEYYERLAGEISNALADIINVKGRCKLLYR